jgi:hypothetical protein
MCNHVARSHDMLLWQAPPWWASAITSELRAPGHQKTTTAESNTSVDPQHPTDTAHTLTVMSPAVDYTRCIRYCMPTSY